MTSLELQTFCYWKASKTLNSAPVISMSFQEAERTIRDIAELGASARLRRVADATKGRTAHPFSNATWML